MSDQRNNRLVILTVLDYLTGNATDATHIGRRAIFMDFVLRQREGTSGKIKLLASRLGIKKSAASIGVKRASAIINEIEKIKL